MQPNCFEISSDCSECEVCGDVMDDRITRCCDCKKPVCARHLHEGVCDIWQHKAALKAQRKAETRARIMSGETMYGPGYTKN